jgi:hypothetical protein
LLQEARLTQNPILKVLLTLRSHEVRFLLIGGQACIFYGGAEFSRDTDIIFLADPKNLQRLKEALAELRAKRIAVPPFNLKHLRRGHAVHFRCHHPDAEGIRLDVLAKLRAVPSFRELWERRVSAEITPRMSCDIASVQDLVLTKKTQRDKDWPMIRRLVEAHFVQNRNAPGNEDIAFWFLESRTPTLLIQLAHDYPDLLEELMPQRPLLRYAELADEAGLENALAGEEQKEREADRRYWAPLRKELEQMRHAPHSRPRGAD